MLEQAKNNELSINDAEVLTVLPSGGANIVVEVMKDEGLSFDSLQPLVKMAKEKTGKLTKTDLKGEIGDLKRQRRETRDKLNSTANSTASAQPT